MRKLAAFGAGLRYTIKGGTGSGEGSDREVAEGDVKLTGSEIRDILALNKNYEKFMLVLNVGGVVDLSPVMEVGNILLLSQLGVDCGRILADIITGKQNPSGKLTTTWAAFEEYSKEGSFGDWNDTCYNEGIYVGYRYFDTFKKQALFPFGYGLSYTSFEQKILSVCAVGEIITVKVEVKNTGCCAGKEVVQVYLSLPQGKLDKGIAPLVMADGPAGIRVARRYYEDEKGVYGADGVGMIPESVLEMMNPLVRFIESQPKALMTSYNLLNGTHTSEHRGLIENVLRAEYGFKGIVMTDWVIALMKSRSSTYRNAFSNEVAKAGGDLFMPGSKGDYERV